MRNDKDLINIACDHFHLFRSTPYLGLCGYFQGLKIRRIITNKEYDRLIRIIKKYRISPKNPFKRFYNKARPIHYVNGFWWMPGNSHYRIRYLQYLKRKFNKL